MCCIMFAYIIMEIRIDDVMQDNNITVYDDDCFITRRNLDDLTRAKHKTNPTKLGALVRVHKDLSVRIHPEY